MSDMDQAQFTKACGALASAWKNISDSGQVYGINNEDRGVYVQVQWETKRELFPDTQLEFFNRWDKTYPCEARVFVEGVKVIALLTSSEQERAVGKGQLKEE